MKKTHKIVVDILLSKRVSFKLYTYGTINLREITQGKKLLCGVFTPRHSRKTVKYSIFTVIFLISYSTTYLMHSIEKLTRWIR